MELQQILFIREDNKREKEETIGGTNRKQITKMVKKKIKVQIYAVLKKPTLNIKIQCT